CARQLRLRAMDYW
nr:immunoglobulin heavy chain junction region [Mus musculus]